VNAAANILHKQVQAKPDSVLGLATGGTMLRLYAEFIALCRQKSTTLSKITTFNLDEYVGLASVHPHSYHSYMQEHLFSKTDIDINTTYLPRGDAPDPHQEAASYETLIKNAGGIDIQLLGIGKNGHIGFNEPSSSLASRTRVKTLSVGTIEANRQYFQGDCEFPKMAITMGVGTIMNSRECILVATGADKAEAIAKMVEGPVTASCPASVLQFHQNVTVLIDEQAASALQMRAYYQQVHPRGYNND
jgi:glucosamine-6-phosphate deaminase|tara:strand:+ start:147 stop:887 length:741 start_codon:yes stop_codon:yes gene_type:complete